MSSTDKIIILESSDGETFEVKEAVARRSSTISRWIDVGSPDDAIHLHEVTGKILSKVIEYWEMHVVDFDDLKAWGAEVDQTALFDLIQNFSKLIVHYKEPVVDGVDLKAWDAEFVKVDQATLFDLIKAAHYLDIKGLLDLTCQTVANQPKSLPPEEIRALFSIRNTFEPEEEEEIRRENRWFLSKKRYLVEANF